MKRQTINKVWWQQVLNQLTHGFAPGSNVVNSVRISDCVKLLEVGNARMFLKKFHAKIWSQFKKPGNECY